MIHRFLPPKERIVSTRAHTYTLHTKHFISPSALACWFGWEWKLNGSRLGKKHLCEAALFFLKKRMRKGGTDLGKEKIGYDIMVMTKIVKFVQIKKKLKNKPKFTNPQKSSCPRMSIRPVLLPPRFPSPIHGRANETVGYSGDWRTLDWPSLWLALLA